MAGRKRYTTAAGTVFRAGKDDWMRILHTSDWHFGKVAPVIGTYEEDQHCFLTGLQGIIEEERIDAVLCAGDVYDSARVAGDAIRLYTDAATMICIEERKPFVVIAGNHDSADRLASCDELLEKAGLFVRGRLGDSLSPILLDEGRVAVYAIPFFQPGEAAAVFSDPGIRTMSDAVRAVLDHIRASLNKTRCNILMAHLSVSGAELSESDRTAINTCEEDGHVIGGSSSVNPSLFSGFDYVALGHIHKPQRLSEIVCYSGSPVMYSFGREEKQTKGVWIFDTETRELSFHEIKKLHERKTLACTYAEAMALDNLKDVYLRLTVTDRLLSPELQSALSARFPLLLELAGKQPAESGSRTSLSSADLKALSPRQILSSFMNDLYEEELADDLASLFLSALEQAEKEGAQ